MASHPSVAQSQLNCASMTRLIDGLSSTTRIFASRLMTATLRSRGARGKRGCALLALLLVAPWGAAAPGGAGEGAGAPPSWIAYGPTGPIARTIVSGDCPAI